MSCARPRAPRGTRPRRRSVNGKLAGYELARPVAPQSLALIPGSDAESKIGLSLRQLFSTVSQKHESQR